MCITSVVRDVQRRMDTQEVLESWSDIETDESGLSSEDSDEESDDESAESSSDEDSDTCWRKISGQT